MNLLNFRKCPLCYKDPCDLTYSLDEDGYALFKEYLICNDCFTEFTEDGPDNLIAKYKIHKYSINQIHSDYFIIKIEKDINLVTTIYLNKNIPTVKVTIIDGILFSNKRSIDIPYDKKIFNSNDLIELIKKVDNIKSLI